MFMLGRMVTIHVFMWIFHFLSLANSNPNGATMTSRVDLGLSESQEICLNNVTNFVRRDRLCKTPERYFPKSQKLKSCVNRCGVSRKYGTFLECACDEKCEIYNDCCHDLHEQCGDHRRRGKSAVSHLAGASVTCAGSNLLVLENKHFGATMPSYTYQEKTTTTIETSTVADGRFVKANLSLETIMKDFNAFKVVEESNGIVFNDFQSFRSWGNSISGMLVVPQITTLGCSREYMGAPDERNLLRILPFCVSAAMLTVPSIYDRSCKHEGRIFCICERSLVFNGYLRDACFSRGKLREEFSFNRRFKEYKDEYDVCSFNDVHLSSRGPEDIIQRNDELEITKPWTGSIGKEQDALSMTITPVLDIERLYNNTDTDKDLYLGPFEFKPKSFLDVPMKFVVDVRGTLERRLRCPSFDGPLSECHLEECTDGTFLMESTDSPWSFDGHVCVNPDLAVIEDAENVSKIGACNCLQMMNALAALSLWDVKIPRRFPDQCVVQMRLLSQEIAEIEPPALGIYNFSSANLAKPTVQKNFWPLGIHDLAEFLEDEMTKTTKTCVEQMPENTRICFYYWKMDTQLERELITCASLSFSLRFSSSTPSTSTMPGNTANVIVLELNTIWEVVVCLCVFLKYWD